MLRSLRSAKPAEMRAFYAGADNEEEAVRVRQIFEWYLEGQNVFGIVAKCIDLGWHDKQWTTKEGKLYGGHLRGAHDVLAGPRYHIQQLLTVRMEVPGISLANFKLRNSECLPRLRVYL